MNTIFLNRVFASIIVVLLVFPLFVFAQVEQQAVVQMTESPNTMAELPPVIDTVTDETASGADNDEIHEVVSEVPVGLTEETPDTERVQETANAQEMIDGEVLENTANPETQRDEEAVVVEIPMATSTVELVAVVAEPEASEVPPEDVVIEEPVLDVIAEVLPSEPAPESQPILATEAEVIELKPDVDPTYVVALSGKTIPTKKKGMIGTAELVQAPQTAIDGEDGTLNVSGTCAGTYYVVLIFKNQTDYEADPRSFIMNRAYPCENGTYSYSIDRLPPTLTNGTYYLMIADQGERGPWTPATGLTEITINRSN